LLDQPLALAARGAARRIGRKAVVIAFDTGIRSALRVAEAESDHVSDVIGLGPVDCASSMPSGLRLHIIGPSKAAASPNHTIYHVRGSRALLSVNPDALRILAAVLRDIPITLLNPP
jgi:hypothetical protein